MALFNPNAIAVSEGVRDELSTFPELEFLPVDVRGHGVFFILHVVATVELPVDALAKFTSPPRGSLFRVEAFPAAFDPPFGFFRVLHPKGAAARQTGGVAQAVYLTTVLLVVLFVLVAHVWLTIACIWVAIEMIRRSRVSAAIRWSAVVACIAISILDLPWSFSLSAGTGLHPFILRYAWPALVCIVASALWSWRTDSIRKV